MRESFIIVIASRRRSNPEKNVTITTEFGVLLTVFLDCFVIKNIPRNDNNLFIPLAVEASAVILAKDSMTLTQLYAFLETVLLFKIGF